jgi:hypothetical protein
MSKNREFGTIFKPGLLDFIILNEYKLGRMTPKTPTFRLAPWKWFTMIWMTVVLVAGFAISIPRIPILEESARNSFLA